MKIESTKSETTIVCDSQEAIPLLHYNINREVLFVAVYGVWIAYCTCSLCRCYIHKTARQTAELAGRLKLSLSIIYH